MANNQLNLSYKIVIKKIITFYIVLELYFSLIKKKELYFSFNKQYII